MPYVYPPPPGPVGISDAIGHTNMTLARATADASGRLLQPSQPIAALDVNFAIEPVPRPAGYIWSTVTAVPAGAGQPSASPHVYVLGLMMSAVRDCLSILTLVPTTVLSPSSLSLVSILHSLLLIMHHVTQTYICYRIFSLFYSQNDSCHIIGLHQTIVSKLCALRSGPIKSTSRSSLSTEPGLNALTQIVGCAFVIVISAVDSLELALPSGVKPCADGHNFEAK